MADDSPPSEATMPDALLMELLKQTVGAATRSAEGATASAAALQGMEGRMAEMHAAVQANTTAVAALATEKQQDREDREERGRWLRTFVSPQNVYYTLLIIGSALGIRISLLPDVPTLPQPSPQTQGGGYVAPEPTR